MTERPAVAALRAEWERDLSPSFAGSLSESPAFDEHVVAFVEKLFALLEGAALEAPPEPRDESAWLIESQASGQPVWWTGKWYPVGGRIVYGPLHSAYSNPTSVTDMEPQFSPDHAEALRFARQQDAERAVGLLPVFYRSAVRVNEHMWMVRGEAPPEPGGLLRSMLVRVRPYVTNPQLNAEVGALLVAPPEPERCTCSAFLHDPDCPERGEALGLDEIALAAAERAYWQDDGVSRHNLAAAILAYLGAVRAGPLPPDREREFKALTVNRVGLDDEPPIYVYRGPHEGMRAIQFPEIENHPIVLTPGVAVELRWVRGVVPAPPPDSDAEFAKLAAIIASIPDERRRDFGTFAALLFDRGVRAVPAPQEGPHGPLLFRCPQCKVTTPHQHHD